MRRMAKLLLGSVFAGAVAIASCQHPPSEERAPRIVESSTDIFVPEDANEHVRESLLEDAPPVPRAPPQKTAMVARVPAWLERAMAEAREVETPPAPIEPMDPIAEPTPPVRFLPPPPLPVKPAPLPLPQEPAPDRSLTDATNVALAIGAIGVGMSAAVVGADDVWQGEKVLAAGWLGIGIAGFATAGILYSMDPNPKKTINFMAGPGAVGARGSF